MRIGFGEGGGVKDLVPERERFWSASMECSEVEVGVYVSLLKTRCPKMEIEDGYQAEVGDGVKNRNCTADDFFALRLRTALTIVFLSAVLAAQQLEFVLFFDECYGNDCMIYCTWPV